VGQKLRLSGKRSKKWIPHYWKYLLNECRKGLEKTDTNVLADSDSKDEVIVWAPLPLNFFHMNK
jgi:hypothetical protein